MNDQEFEEAKVRYRAELEKLDRDELIKTCLTSAKTAKDRRTRPQSKAWSKARREADSSERAALINTLVSKTKRKLRFFQEVVQQLRGKAAGPGLLTEVGHQLL